MNKSILLFSVFHDMIRLSFLTNLALKTKKYTVIKKKKHEDNNSIGIVAFMEIPAKF